MMNRGNMNLGSMIFLDSYKIAFKMQKFEERLSGFDLLVFEFQKIWRNMQRDNTKSRKTLKLEVKNRNKTWN